MFASNQPQCPGVQLYNNEQLGRRGGGGVYMSNPTSFCHPTPMIYNEILLSPNFDIKYVEFII